MSVDLQNIVQHAARGTCEFGRRMNLCVEESL